MTTPWRDPRDVNLQVFIDLAAPYGKEIQRRMVLIAYAESEGLVFANNGEGLSGGSINVAQSEVLKGSLQLPHDTWPPGTRLAGQKCVGSNGGSVGITQMIPTDVARLASRPWGGWGTIAQCMDVRYAAEKTLTELRRLPITDDPVRDCFAVQRWLIDDTKGFEASPETQNYRRRLDTVEKILGANGRYFTDPSRT